LVKNKYRYSMDAGRAILPAFFVWWNGKIVKQGKMNMREMVKNIR